jgi:hypothetical protein
MSQSCLDRLLSRDPTSGTPWIWYASCASTVLTRNCCVHSNSIKSSCEYSWLFSLSSATCHTSVKLLMFWSPMRPQSSPRAMRVSSGPLSTPRMTCQQPRPRLSCKQVCDPMYQRLLFLSLKARPNTPHCLFEPLPYPRAISVRAIPLVAPISPRPPVPSQRHHSPFLQCSICASLLLQAHRRLSSRCRQPCRMRIASLGMRFRSLILPFKKCLLQAYHGAKIELRQYLQMPNASLIFAHLPRARPHPFRTFPQRAVLLDSLHRLSSKQTPPSR